MTEGALYSGGGCLTGVDVFPCGGCVGGRHDESALPLSLSRFNYAWPTYEGHPAMLEGVATRLLCWHRGLTGWNEARQLVYSPTGEGQERGQDRRSVQGPPPARGPPCRGGVVDHKSG